MKLRMGLIGSGISRSRMPQLQEYLGQLAGIPVSYSLIDGEGIPDFDPAEELRSLSQLGFRGVNVTHPYKQAVYEAVDSAVYPGHELIGSYNTLKFQGSHILGANTDYTGFQRAFIDRLGGQAPGSVVLCGAGGVGRAVAFGLAELGADEIVIFDVAVDQANSLHDALAGRGVSASVIQEAELAGAVLNADGLANCTTLGMYSYPGNAFPETAIGKQRWAFDAVYTPLETKFLGLCACNGIRCVSGFDLWIHQGLDAFEVFAGIQIEPSRDIIETALGWLD